MKEYKVVISAKAQLDLSECVSFILNVSKEAAHALANDIYSSIENLSVFPEKNPVFEMPKYCPFTIRKQIVNKRYAILYAIEDTSVVVHRIIDCRRNFNYLIA